MEAMTSGHENKLAESLQLLNHIIDNPVSFEESLETKKTLAEKTTDEIKIVLDKKRKKQIDKLRASFIDKKVN